MVFVLVAGNQIGALQRIVGSAEVNRLGDAARIQVLVQAMRGSEPRTVDPAVLKPTDPAWDVSTTLTPMDPADFNAWEPSRAIYDDSADGTITIDGRMQRDGTQQSEVITEFPFFSFYLGDLHPHVLALPFVILVLGLALNTLMRTDLPAGVASGRGRLELALTGLIIGSPYMINSWDAPTYGALYAATLALLVRQHHGRPLRRFWRAYAQQLGLVLSAALLLFLPFLLTFDSFAGRTTVPEPFANWPLIGTLGQIIAPARDHSGWTDLVAIFGLFLIPLTAWWTHHVRSGRAWLLILFVLGSGVAVGIPALVFAPVAVLLLRAAWQHTDPRVSTFILLISALGCLLLLVSDLVYLRDIFDRRLNTVFKTYYQAWLLLGVAAAYAVWSLLHSQRWRRAATLAWLPLFLVFGAGALVYPVSVLSPSTTPSGDGPQALDGLVHSSQFTIGAREAAAWLTANASGNAVLAGAPGKSYADGGEVATLSGRPTLLGWWNAHENLWRTKQPDAHAAIQTRLRDLETLYTSPDPVAVRALLTQYGVTYIIWGPSEQQTYPTASTATLERVATRVHEANGWALFQVMP